jgi:hypothetical protein
MMKVASFLTDRLFTAITASISPSGHMYLNAIPLTTSIMEGVITSGRS